MAVTVTYAATCTVAETLAENTGSAAAASRLVTHSEYNESATLNSGTTPPVTKCAHFLATLSGGALTIDLTAMTGTNGATIDGTGLKVQVVRVKNLGANSLVVSAGASNGHSGFWPATPGLTIPPGGHVMLYSNDNGDDIASGDRTWDLAGTSSQTSEWTIVVG